MKQKPTVAPTIYQPVAVPVYDHMPVYNHMLFMNQPPKAGTPVGSYERSMYIPPASGYYDTQSMAGYNTMQPQPVYSEERVYAEHGAIQEFYEDPPDSGPVTVNNTGHAGMFSYIHTQGSVHTERSGKISCFFKLTVFRNVNGFDAVL